MYTFSSKSGSEPFRAYGDLTWNDTDDLFLASRGGGPLYYFFSFGGRGPFSPFEGLFAAFISYMEAFLSLCFFGLSLSTKMYAGALE